MGSTACPACARPVVRITMRVERRVVVMSSCRACDARWWTADGQPVEPAAAVTRTA